MNIDTDANTVAVSSARIVDRVGTADLTPPARRRRRRRSSRPPSRPRPTSSVTARWAPSPPTSPAPTPTWSRPASRRTARPSRPSATWSPTRCATSRSRPSPRRRPSASSTRAACATNLFFKGDLTTSPENADGVVTFEEANAVLPFVNNINYVDVTGATLKKVFEQQWQPATASNAFLHLGVSKNVQTTLDPSRPLGDRGDVDQDRRPARGPGQDLHGLDLQLPRAGWRQLRRLQGGQDHRHRRRRP